MYKPILSYEPLEIDHPYDLIHETTKTFCEQTIKKRDDLIKKAIKDAGYNFENEHELIQLMKDKAQVLHLPDCQIKQLVIEDKLICMWDEDYQFEHKDNKFNVTFRFAARNNK
jgi:hypothetical protein